MLGGNVNASDVERLVNAEIDGFVHEQPAPGSTIGVPWSEQKVLSYLPKLRAALVKPYQQRFVLGDTWAQIQATSPELAEYWVIAESDPYIEFFDPLKNEFGLANRSVDGGVPVTIGVRGDLVGVFCAM
jgi:hypothetical protein